MRPIQATLTLYLTTFAICIGLIAVPTACSGNQRQRTLHTVLVSANVARDGFVSWDAAHQAQIVSSASSRAEAEIRLVAYRERRDKLVAEFERLYRALATAATQDDRPSLVAAEEFGRKLLVELAAIKGAP